jgi:hypothetical protein
MLRWIFRYVILKLAVRVLGLVFPWLRHVLRLIFRR